MKVEEHNVDRQKGSGSLSSIEDEMTGDKFDTKDERAGTHTTFYMSDVESLPISKARKNQFYRMHNRQEGQHVNSTEYDSRGTQNYKEDVRRFITTTGSQLELTPAQKKRVKHLVMDILDINSFGSYSSEKVVLGTTNVVAREDGRYIEDEAQFQDFMEAVGIENLSTMRRLRELVRERLPSYDD